MKPLILLFAALLSLFISCTPQASRQETESFVFNGNGHYFSGSYIFSDQESMHTVVMLLPDSLFLLLKRVNDETQWQANAGNWQFKNEQLLLDGGNESRLLSRWSGRQLEVLNNAGESILKEKKFLLSEISSDSAARLSFEITGAYRWFADAASLSFCEATKTIPVLMTEANIEAERAYLLHRENTGRDKLFMQVDARLSRNDQSESSLKAALTIQKVKQTFPEMECY
ncbi:MAG: hypothetical protein PHG67_09720 [Bacteroidales bacterium]|jgi:uncharacterized lipoprotein NlpE involved in copper resistance|nr:hypothetical protein [Bacteroidales bacterium]HOI32864.1 hypothetical protein [Bacteroidales bacterium]